MSRQANYFKIGLFVLAGVILVVASIVVLGAGVLFEKTITIETYIDGSVQGLDPGSPLKFRGVTIGRVKDILVVSWVYPTKHTYILVRSTVPTNNNFVKSSHEASEIFAREVEKGLRVRLATPGITGTAYLEVDYLDPTQNPELKIDWTPQHPYLPSAPSMITRVSDSLTRIMSRLEEIDIKALIASLDKTLAAATTVIESTNMSDISHEAKELLAELRQTNKNIDQFFSSAKTNEILTDTSAMLASGRRIVEGTEKPLVQFLAALKKTSQTVEDLAKKLNTGAGSLPETVVQLQTAIRRLDNLLAAPQQNLEETMDNLKAVSRNLRDLSHDLKKYPAHALFGEPPAPAKPGGKP